MHIKKIEIAGKYVMPFTIPSGIVTTDVRCAKKLLEEIPEIGIWTTKSIGPSPRIIPERDEVENPREGVEYANRETIILKYDSGCPGSFMNRVGLNDEGALAMRKKIIEAHLPADKIINASLRGKTWEDFVATAKVLEDVVNMMEVNVSCPHAKGYGKVLGQDPEMVYSIISALKSNVHNPVFAKFGPDFGTLENSIKAALKAGVDGLVLINTAGPGYYSIDGHQVLAGDGFGGLSGEAIRPLGLRAVRMARQIVGNIPIFAMGGISTAEHIRQYQEAGAGGPMVFGIGSGLAGMDSEAVVKYFPAIVSDANNGTNKAKTYLRNVDMTYKKLIIDEVVSQVDDFKIFRTSSKIDCGPGQFGFVAMLINGRLEEKPVSIMDDNPLTFGILSRGYFTGRFNNLKSEDSFFFRGPYGKSVEVPQDSSVVLVGGGCGIAGLYLPAKRLSENVQDIQVFLGAKDKQHLGYLKEFERFAEVRIATDDGSLGTQGFVTDLLRREGIMAGSYFFNCGPKAMVNAILPFELATSSREKIFSSLDYLTSCGIGLCGRSVNDRGERTCVDGPFMNP